MAGNDQCLAISPHLDDAVFACGERLAAHPGSVVLTVFAGIPSDGKLRTEWDRRCGFRSARQALAARHIEDTAALAHLQAHPLRMAFCDNQYGAPHNSGRGLVQTLISALAELRPQTVLIPLGLLHRDHARTHRACLLVMRRLASEPRRWLAYEDVPYRQSHGVLQRRLAALAAQGFIATPDLTPLPASKAKARAVRCYESQLRGLNAPGGLGEMDMARPERCWILKPTSR